MVTTISSYFIDYSESVMLCTYLDVAILSIQLCLSEYDNDKEKY